MKNILDEPLAKIAADLRGGKFKAIDLAAAVIHNHNRTDQSLSAYKTWDENIIHRQAKTADLAFSTANDCGPLQGLPVSVKDLFGVNGFPTFAGSCKQLPKKWEREGPVIRVLRKQLATVTGKTHNAEFAFGGLGVNPHWDTPRNPWDNREYRVPGGSSSGAGVSLCVGSAVLALGTDTAGSVRIPASMTGAVGLKTSIGRWSTDGIVPLSPSLDTVGLLARCVHDVAYGFFSLDSSLNTTAGHFRDFNQREISGLRLGICDGLLWDDCSPGIAESVKAALHELTKNSTCLLPISVPELQQVYSVFRAGGLAAPELYAFLKAELAPWFDLLDEKIAQRMDDAATLSAVEYLGRSRLFNQLSRKVQQRMEKIDFMVSPTVAITPPTLAEVEDTVKYRETNLLSLRNTSIVNCLGLCALTMPVGVDSAGMPVGLQLIAPRGSEVKLLAAASGFERYLGTGWERLGSAPTKFV